MSEHDNLAEAREALRTVLDYSCTKNVSVSRRTAAAILAAIDGHAAALAAARAEGAAEAFEKAAKVCDEAQMSRPSHWFVAALIRALAEEERGGRRA